MNTWKDQARERFSTTVAAPKWDAMYERPTERLEEENFRLRCEYAIELIRQRFEPGAAIVDLGCGAAPVLAGLWERGYRALGVDCSPDMLAYARRRLAAIGGDPDVLMEGDVTALPFTDASMDCVVCLGVISYVPEPVQALREIHRILRPAGVAIISFRNRFNPLFSDPVVALKYLARRVVSGDPGVKRAIGQFLDPRDVRRAIDTAGLHIEHLEGIGLGPFRLARRPLLSERRAIRLSRRLTAWATRMRLDGWVRRMSDVNIFVCSRPEMR